MAGPKPYRTLESSFLRGAVRIPSDKSISHRAVLLSAIAVGTSEIHGLLPSADVLGTVWAMRALGVRIDLEEGVCRVHGAGLSGLRSPEGDLDFGNSGTGVRLSLGLMATSPLRARCVGDASLCARPMGRVLAPLREMGADFLLESGEKLPLTLLGAKTPTPLTYRLPVASAQVKSAILLAGLGTPGKTTVIEPIPTRDHTERMLARFGAQIETVEREGERHICVTGHKELCAQHLVVPSDPSSAAFIIAAALVCPHSEVLVTDVLLNPMRIGFIETVQEMGADLTIEDRRDIGGETLGTLRVRTSRLKGVRVRAERAPSMIDEYPILAVLSALAEGTTRMEGLGELRVKESDRLAAVTSGLMCNGISARSGDDWLEVEGGGDLGRHTYGGGMVKTHLDHRIAMAFLILGLALKKGVSVDDTTMIGTSFPNFFEILTLLGAHHEDLTPIDGGEAGS